MSDERIELRKGRARMVGRSVVGVAEQVWSRRTVEVFDDQACSGYATEAGSWTFVGGTGRYADLRGHGRLSAYASYFGVGDAQDDCAGISERFTLYLEGKVARQR